MRVAFQGEHGAYSEEALVLYFGRRAEAIPCPYVNRVFQLVESNGVSHGVLPLENTLAGSVPDTYDVLLQSSLQIQGEVILRISHCLIANPGVSLCDVKRVYSHPQALEQCRSFLEQHGLEAIPTYDTAGSVMMLRENKAIDAAAIASARAAKAYKMRILARSIESNIENYTRFIVIGKTDHVRTGRDRTTVVFPMSTADLLYKSLDVLAKHNINPTKMESRPIVGKPWKYWIYLDFDGHREDLHIRHALSELNVTTSVRVLGSYPRWPGN